MYYPDFDETLKSSFSKNNLSFANLIGESQLPVFGFKASELLNKKQMQKLAKIRLKRMKKTKNFISD